MSADVNASQIMQNKVMNDDDYEWHEELFKIMHDFFLEPRFTVGHASPGKAGLRAEPSMDQGLNAGLELSLRSCLLETDIITEPDDTEKKRRKKKKKKTQEFNAVATGAVAGYTLPLGASNKPDDARKKNAEINARFFGNGIIVGDY